MPDVADVVVIGGGCMGTSIAWQLAQRKAGRIVLLEQRGLAAGATGRSSALIRQHYTHEALARMALHSLRVFERFDEVVGGNAEFRRTGFLVLVAARDAPALTANVAMHRRVGIDARLLTPEEVGALESRLVRHDVGAAAWEPESGYADPYGVTVGYAAAARQHGAELRVGVGATELGLDGDAVEGVRTTAGRIATRTVVVAAGYASRALLAPHGVDLPLRPVRHAIAIVERSPQFGAPHPTISDRVLWSYYRPEAAALTLIGSTAAFEGRDDPEADVDRAPEYEETSRLAERFYRRFPGEHGAVLRRGYTGVYDCSPDLQPMLGPLPEIAGLHLAVGFSGHGFKLSPAVGELIAEEIVEGRTSLVDIELFSPGRFAANRPIRAEHPYSVATPG